jgi:hypothetical protein
MRIPVFLAVMLWMPFACEAATYQVGPTRPHTTLQALLSAVTLHADDLVEVDGNVSYAGGVVFENTGTLGHPITVRGLRVSGLRPLISGGANGVEFRLSDHMVFEGFEITGATSRCLYHHADDILVRDVLIRDCPGNGIQSSDLDSGSLTLEYSEIHHAGAGTLRHMMYIQTDEVAHPGSIFTMRFCYIHDGNGGNMLKSRAERNAISYNWMEGAFYRELELIGPDPGTQDGSWTETLKREDSDVVGNVLVHTTANSSFVVRAGGDGTGQTNGRYRFVNNTVVLNAGTTVFQLFDGIESIEMHNNVVYRPAGAATVLNTDNVVWATSAALIAGSNNWIQTGAGMVPAQWSGTIFGSAPGFINPVAYDLHPAIASALLDSATGTPTGVPAHDYPGPIFPPIYQPPSRSAILPGTAAPRPMSGALDIGAYETAQDLIFRDGFGP